MNNIVLTSQSPYRAQQLKQLGLVFTQFSPDINELPHDHESAEQAALRLAEQKADSYYSNRVNTKISDNSSSRTPIETRPEHINELIIAADQTVGFGAKILGKPYTFENAHKQLEAFSGNVVTFNSALCVSFQGHKKVSNTTTTVKFLELSERQINHYLNKEQPFDCAGSFKSEGLGISLFESIESKDPTALIGLPLISLCNALRYFGVEPLS